MSDLYLGPPKKTSLPEEYQSQALAHPSEIEKEEVTVFTVIVKKIRDIELEEERVVQSKSIFVEHNVRTTCTRPEQEDLSFATRYAYDKVDFLAILTGDIDEEGNGAKLELPQWVRDVKPEEIMASFPEFEEEIMEDTEPHPLLLDQAGYTGKGKPPYPRKIKLPKITSHTDVDDGPQEPIVIPMDFLNDPLDNFPWCMVDHNFRCEKNDLWH